MLIWKKETRQERTSDGNMKHSVNHVHNLLAFLLGKMTRQKEHSHTYAESLRQESEGIYQISATTETTDLLSIVKQKECQRSPLSP